MRRTSTLSTSMVFVLLLVLAVNAQGQERRRAAAPMLTNDDVLAPAARHSVPEEGVSKTNLTGSALSNPRAILEGALTKMAGVNSMRTRLQTTLPEGQTEVLIESIKPDRIHVILPQAEMISVGRKFYVRSTGGWVVQSEPPGGQIAGLFDSQTFLKEMRGKFLSGVQITGQVLGSQAIDGVETVAYEFTITDSSETGTVQISVGKGDGFMRRMFLSGGRVDIKFWFTDINQPISIEPPM